jgi:hypothetical protein
MHALDAAILRSVRSEADVDRDPQPELAGELDVVLGGFDGRELGTARRHRQCHQRIVARQRLLAQAAYVGRVRQRTFLHPALRLDAGLAVCINRSAAGLAQRSDRLISMSRRVLDVRPVEQGGHAAVERGESAKQCRGIDVLRSEVGSESLEQFDEHARQVPVQAGVADRALPGVTVRIDQSGKDQIVGGIDDLAVAGIDPRGHLLDLSVSHQHIAGELAEAIVHRDNKSAPQDVVAVSWRPDVLLIRHVALHEPR